MLHEYDIIANGGYDPLLSDRVNGHDLLENDSVISPYPGAMADIVTNALNSANKPQPALTLLAVLIGMASACGSAYKFQNGGRVNLYGIGVADTASGKELPRIVAESIADAAGTEVQGKPGSGQGLEDALIANGHKLLLGIDEIAHLMECLNSSTKQGYMIELSSNLLKLFTASRTFYRKRKLANKKGFTSGDSISNPFVNIIGFSTPQKLGMAVNTGNIEDGLLGRMLFAIGENIVTPRRNTPEFLLPVSALETIGRINRFNDTVIVRVSGHVIGISSSANKRLDEIIQEFEDKKDESNNLFAKALYGRSYELTERVAGVLAIWDCPESPVIELCHIDWAYKYVMNSVINMIAFNSDYMHGGETQADGALIMKMLEDGKRRGWSDCLKKSKLDKKRFDSAVLYLEDRAEVEVFVFDAQNINGRKYKAKFLTKKIG